MEKALCYPIENLVLGMNNCRWLCPEILQSCGARRLALFPVEIDAVTRVCFLAGNTSAQFSGLGGDLMFAVLSVCPMSPAYPESIKHSRRLSGPVITARSEFF